jgi:hypothetical protein
MLRAGCSHVDLASQPGPWIVPVIQTTVGIPLAPTPRRYGIRRDIEEAWNRELRGEVGMVAGLPIGFQFTRALRLVCLQCAVLIVIQCDSVGKRSVELLG